LTPLITMNFESIISSHLSEHLATVEKLKAHVPFIEDLARRILACLDAGGKVLFFGNGGSAADAQHLAAEFVVRFRQNRRALPSLALHTDTSVMTACANDFGFDTVYARQIEAMANAGDVAIGISTSGNSVNVLKALEAAKAKGCLSVAFTAESGGKCADVADLTFRAPSPVTARAQECHLLTGHILCDLVEESFVQRGS
jgi:D-sedoheptulose 7-phosphate isomerase